MQLIKRALELGPRQTVIRGYWHLREYALTLYWKRRLQRTAPSPLPFSRHIPIPNPATTSCGERHTDIRSVWQESLDNLFTMQATAETFKTQMTSWFDANPFMRGVHWMNSMEVARRAINMITAYHHYALATNPDTNFVKRYTESLQEHLVYLRTFPETSATPNNHYLTDLVGQLSLAKFFKITKEMVKLEQLLDHEFNRQILPDGTSYEGSTGYHCYVTELFAHYLTLKPKPTLADRARLHTMLAFITRLTPPNLPMVCVGDQGVTLTATQDSLSPGLHPRTHNAIAKQTVIPFDESYFYANFGLGIIAHRPWYITLRQPIYQKHQPTGHFHDDELSITLSYDTIQILVDPGSGLYTGNPLLRNTLRHASSHNTFAPVTPISYPNLFLTPKTPCQPPAIDLPHYATLTRQDSTQTRTLMIDADTGTITINDSWTASKPITLAWNFIFHPDITITQISPTELVLRHTRQSFILATSLPVTLSQTPYSPTYGKILETSKATATAECSGEGVVITTMRPN